jgi:hypothetical protein
MVLGIYGFRVLWCVMVLCFGAPVKSVVYNILYSAESASYQGVLDTSAGVHHLLHTEYRPHLEQHGHGLGVAREARLHCAAHPIPPNWLDELPGPDRDCGFLGFQVLVVFVCGFLVLWFYGCRALGL